jgi:hypothetical protein
MIEHGRDPDTSDAPAFGTRAVKTDDGQRGVRIMLIALWEAVAGEPGWRERAGELAYLGPPGCLCRTCFELMATELGIDTVVRVMRREDYVRWRDQENAASWGDDEARYWQLHPENAPALPPSPAAVSTSETEHP